MDVPVNYWAVLVCGVASIALGSLWYGPLFGKMWMKMMGWDKMDPSKVEQIKKGAAKGYVVSFVGALVMSYVLAHYLVFASVYTETEGVSAGLMVGFWTWLGFIAPVTLGSVLWDGKPLKLWVLNNGYNLIQLLIIGTILALWK